jgi:hypothetical protein
MDSFKLVHRGAVVTALSVGVLGAVVCGLLH